MKELIGRKIKALYVSEGESDLRVEHDSGSTTFRTHGDCCSESWFADIIGLRALEDAVVLEVEEVPMSRVENDSRTRQQWDEIYGYRLKTTNGFAEITFRNSSNGYYGGWVTAEENMPIPSNGMAEIPLDDADEWSA